jgi:uncharacterized protein YndB with AHSA1/START domain
MRPDQVYELWIRTTPERLWEAITSPDWTHRYFHETRIESTWEAGSPVVYRMENGQPAVEGTVLESSPYTRLSYTWGVRYDEEMAREESSRVTWEITGHGEMCSLRVIHDRFPEGSRVYDHVAGVGWMSILSNLKTLLETGEVMGIS